MKRFIPCSVIIALIYIVANVLVALSAPLCAPYDPTAIVGSPWSPPSSAHWLGLDNLGRDLLSRLIFGARYSIGIAFLVTMISFSIGVYAGFLSGIRGGKIDLILSRFFEIFLSMPTLIFILMILAVFGTSTSVLVLTLGFIDSTRVFRLARLLAQQIYAKEYIEAALLRGENLGWIMIWEILPNTIGLLLAEFALRFVFVFLLIAALSYLGLGVQPPAADWGNMIKDNAIAISLGGWAVLVPALAIALLAAAINLIVGWMGKLERELP